MHPKLKKELRSWGILVAIYGFLYFTGLHLPVISAIQSGLLSTGILNAKIKDKNWGEADFNFQLKDETGKLANLEDFKGKTIFLNFWATWCAPCIAEMPNINALHQKLSTDKIQFVMISVDEDFDKAKEFVNKKGYDLPVFAMTSQRPQVFQNRSIPVTYIISPEGQVVFKETGLNNYNNQSFIEYINTLNIRSY